MTASADRQRPDPRTLHNLADRIERLVPSHRDPLRFFEERSEIAHELRSLAMTDRRRPI